MSLFLVLPTLLLQALVLLPFFLVGFLFPLGLGPAAHPLTGGILGCCLIALQTACISAAKTRPTRGFAVPSQKRVPALTSFAVRAGQLRLPAPTLVVFAQYLFNFVPSRNLVGQGGKNAELEVSRQSGQGVGRLLWQLVLLKQDHVLRDQILPDDFEPGQLGCGDFTSLGHMVPHTTWELKALLFQLVQQHFHPLRLFGQFSRGEHPGVTVAVYEPQLLEGGGACDMLPDTGDFPQVLASLLDQQFQCRLTAVA